VTRSDQPVRIIDADSATRKTFPMSGGLLDYFPDALAAVAQVSWHGNEQHNPGQPLHWSRGKSMDHADCIVRHLIGRGGYDGQIRHSAALAWRALALLQEELEHEYELSMPRNAWIDDPPPPPAGVGSMPGLASRHPITQHDGEI
jgi:hypothetical protein